MRELGLSSAMVVPLRARGRVLGALSLIATHGRAGYGPDDLAFAEQVAARAAMAVDNARLYREAREQQRRAAADREELRAQRDLYEALMRAQSELGEAFAVLDGRADRVRQPRHRAPHGPHRGRAVRARVGVRPRRARAPPRDRAAGCATPASASSRASPAS